MSGRSRKSGRPSASDIPELDARITGVRTDTPAIREYRRVCGFAASSHCPITWPHILAFPLHIRLMTDQAFPFPLLGMVHLRNRIDQHRAIGQGETLELVARLANATDTDRGIEFDIVTEALSGGRSIWTENSTILYRQPVSNGEKKAGSTPAAPQMLSGQATIQASGNIGFQYGRVSGDMNPIHLHPWSAKAFGFPRAIAHGMWSKARCLATLEESEGPVTGASVDVQFKKPFFLPGTAILTWQRGRAGSMPFRLLNKDASAPHLEGSLERL
ncbi:MaoC family dehydratase [Halospina denitrificans]|nr:MaoC/PaaZ C-terminal domain-containing protein [Halospina denitrificans]